MIAKGARGAVNTFGVLERLVEMLADCSDFGDVVCGRTGVHVAMNISSAFVSAPRIADI
jgi:hypothetical protein